MANSHVVVGHGSRRVIALHGWFGSATGWGPLVKSLDLNAFTYAFIDYRGYGAMQGKGGPYTIAQIADDTLALADSLGWNSFALVGHSMGGLAIQQVLVTAPERVRALVGITPVPASGAPFDADGWKLFSSAADSADARRTIIDFTTGNRLCGAWLDRMVNHSLEHSDAAAFGAYLEAWSKTDISAAVKGRTLPVKVVVGAHDGALPEDFIRSTWAQFYPNCEIEVMANAGHYPMEETPVALASTLERFLAPIETP